MRPALTKRIALAAALAPTVLAPAGCVRHLATSALADSLSASGTGFASDDDPELVRDAVPFALKTMEQLLDAEPRHVGLATALARGFTQYAYAFVQQDGDLLEDKDAAGQRKLYQRARRLYLRARDYGLRGLDLRHEGLGDTLRRATRAEETTRALAAATRDDVPLLYWTAAPWALAVGVSKDDMKLVGELGKVELVMARAAALDPDFDEGAIDEFYVAYGASMPAAAGGGVKLAREHFARAVATSHGKKIGALVSYAESVCVPEQDRAGFTKYLGEALAFDADSDPPHRLANLVAQRRARWLQGRAAELFAD